MGGDGGLCEAAFGREAAGEVGDGGEAGIRPGKANKRKSEPWKRRRV